MSRKKNTKLTKSSQEESPKEGETPLAKLRKAQSHDEIASAMIHMVLQGKDDVLSVALDLIKAAEEKPGALKVLTDRLSEGAVALAFLMDSSSEGAKTLAKYVLPYRQRIKDELELDTAHELMLLDAAMDAYIHWMECTRLARLTAANGTGAQNSKLQARLGSLAQSYLKTYMDAMKALHDMKRPSIRILQVRAGENVAIQINEQTKVLEARYAPKLPQQDQRRMLPKSTPAATEAPEEDSD